MLGASTALTRALGGRYAAPCTSDTVARSASEGLTRAAEEDAEALPAAWTDEADTDDDVDDAADEEDDEDDEDLDGADGAEEADEADDADEVDGVDDADDVETCAHRCCRRRRRRSRSRTRLRSLRSGVVIFCFFLFLPAGAFGRAPPSEALCFLRFVAGRGGAGWRPGSVPVTATGVADILRCPRVQI